MRGHYEEHNKSEVDFLIDDYDSLSAVPIEVKSGKDYTIHSALSAFVKNEDYHVKKAYPSYQAYAYATFIKNSSEQVQDDHIGIWPCAYLHNCDPVTREPLDDEIYRLWYEEAPLFDKTQALKLRSFIKQFISKKSSSGDLLYKIDNGRIKPSKALQDCIVSLMKGNEEFILLDDQAVVFDMCKKIMDQCRKDMKKRTIIVQGGPGTGKSLFWNHLCI